MIRIQKPRKSPIQLIIVIVILFFVVIPITNAQKNVEFDKDNFPGREKEYKQAKKNLENGKDLFDRAYQDYIAFTENFVAENGFMPPSRKDYGRIDDDIFTNALPFLELAHQFNPDNDLLNWMIGFIHFEHNQLDEKAGEYLEKAYKLNPNIDVNLPYILGWTHHLHLRWDEAIRFYSIFKTKLNKDLSPIYAQQIEDIQKKIAECNYGKKYTQQPKRVFIDNIGAKINSEYPDYSAYISADEAIMVFTSRRENSTGAETDGDDHSYFEDVYISNKVNGEWSEARNIGAPINTVDHNATAGISPDGNTMYVYSNNGKDGGDIYSSKLIGNSWTQPERLGKTINTSSKENTIAEWYDGSKMVFISNKKGGLGLGDIYMVAVEAPGKFADAKNIGPPINTKYGEEGVFLIPDGKTMYFSSQGHSSMGGYDVFKTTFENGKWSEPENLGFPVNGPDDDVFFSVSGSGRRGYYSSSKEGGLGGQDVYQITFLGPEKPFMLSNEDNLLAGIAQPVKSTQVATKLEVTSNSLTILKGSIFDSNSKKPLEAVIELIDNAKNQILTTFKSNSSTGKYTVMLPSGKNYGIVVKVNDYLFHSENLDIPTSNGYQEIIKDIGLQKISVGSKIVLKNIFFDSDKSTVKDESINELERLAKLLTDFPALKIEISSHTDSKGSDEYNLKLSQSRSETVVNYLINQKKISKERLVAKGYGETKPIADNSLEEGRQQNRRSEFEILSK